MLERIAFGVAVAMNLVFVVVFVFTPAIALGIALLSQETPSQRRYIRAKPVAEPVPHIYSVPLERFYTPKGPTCDPSGCYEIR